MHGPVCLWYIHARMRVCLVWVSTTASLAARKRYVYRNCKEKPVRLPKVTNAGKVVHKGLGVNGFALSDAACSCLVLSHHAISVQVLALHVPQYLGQLHREVAEILKRTV